MGRIRKKSSKRGTTFQKSKIHKKAAETRKKTKRSTKRDPTWKSKKKTDPGIPNTFPFKDQVLAELAAEKRQAEEAKQARKDASKVKADEDEDAPGMSSLAGSSVLTAMAPLPPFRSTTIEEIEAEVPELLDTQLATLQDVLDRADVICEVVDARDILGGRSSFLEGLVQDAAGRVVLVVNKIDLVPRETLQAWLSHLTITTCLFSSHSTPAASTSSSTTPPVFGRQELLAFFRKLAAEKTEDDLVIAFMGLTSVGKTSIVNSLLSPSQKRHSVAPIVPSANSAKHPAPTTSAPVELLSDIGEGKRVRVIDTPGWGYVEDEVEEDRDEDGIDVLEERLAADLLRQNLGRVDRVKDALPLASYIVKRSNAQDLMLCYNVPFFNGGDVEGFLTSLARAGGRVRKHGKPDLEAAARVLLRDWAHNTFPYYSSPPSTSMDSTNAAVDFEQPDMEAVLARCRGRKEMRRESGKGLIRFRGGNVDDRQVVLDDDYTALAGPSDEEDASDDEEDDEADDAFLGDEAALQGLEDEEDEDEEDLEDGDDVDGDEQEAGEEDEEEEEEEEEAPPPSRLKRKGILSPDVRNKTKKPKQSVLCGFEQAGRAGKSESETIA